MASCMQQSALLTLSQWCITYTSMTISCATIRTGYIIELAKFEILWNHKEQQPDTITLLQCAARNSLLN